MEELMIVANVAIVFGVISVCRKKGTDDAD